MGPRHKNESRKYVLELVTGFSDQREIQMYMLGYISVLGFHFVSS